MSLTANIYPSTIALAGNPIKLTINSSSVVSYTIRQADRTIFPEVVKVSSLFSSGYPFRYSQSQTSAQ